MPEDDSLSAQDAAARLRRHLERRVREEAKAAVGAAGVAATLAHIALATGYARRAAEQEGAAAPGADPAS